MPEVPEQATVERPPSEACDDLRSRFGFDRGDDEWLATLRASAAPVTLGKLGRYELLDEIGGGGQGRVYKALQPGTNRSIAIKRLWAGALAGARARARFEREIEAASALSHPGVVAVLGTETIDGQGLLLMEWVDGEPIDRWAGAGEGRPLREVLGAFVQVCEAVAHAHQRGVLHRDLKPSNVMVDREGRARVLDFGLAKLWDQSGAAPASFSGEGFAGTPAYAAPEQVAGRRDEVDTRTDVYALGIILYRLLTGVLPFQAGEDLAALFDAIRHAEPRKPSSVRPSLRRELDAIVLRAIEKQRERRYQSAGELGADVTRFLAGETVLAHPPSLAYQASKFVRRHRLTVGIAATALVLIVAAGIVSSVLAIRLAARTKELSRRTEDLAAAVRSAEQARQAAEQNAERQSMTADLLLEMLSSLSEAVRAGAPDPGGPVLAEARAHLESGRFDDQPELLAALWRTIADASRGLGFTADAKRDIARALAICDSQLGPRHVERGRCLTVAGLLAESRREVAQAEALYRESYEILTEALGAGHRDAARALNNLGCVLKDLDRFDEAGGCLEAALAVRRALHGDLHPEVATTLRNLGTLAMAQRRYEESETRYREALDIATQACGPSNSITVGVLLRLARSVEMQGRLDEAEALLRDALGRAEQFYGVHRLEPALVEHNLANLLARRDRIPEAVEVLRRCLERRRLCLGPQDLMLLRTEVDFGSLLARAERRDEAEAQLGHALALATAAGEQELARQASEWLERLHAPAEQGEGPGAPGGPPG